MLLPTTIHYFKMLFPVSNRGDSPVVLSHLQQSQEHTHIDAKPYTALHDTTTGGSIVFFTMESIYSSCCLKKTSPLLHLNML